MNSNNNVFWFATICKCYSKTIQLLRYNEAKNGEKKKVREGRTKPWAVIGHPNRACSVSEDDWALTSSCFTCLWASTLCWSIIHNKRHLANIQPSWPPRVWSIPVCLATGWIKKHLGLGFRHFLESVFSPGLPERTFLHFNYKAYATGNDKGLKIYSSKANLSCILIFVDAVAKQFSDKLKRKSSGEVNYHMYRETSLDLLILACSVGVFWGASAHFRIRPSPYPASAPTLFRSSIQLQSKMAASNRFI